MTGIPRLCRADWTSLLWNIRFEEIKEAIASYGVHSPFVRQMLNSLLTSISIAL